jgi:hypothetical protein
MQGPPLLPAAFGLDRDGEGPCPPMLNRRGVARRGGADEDSGLAATVGAGAGPRVANSVDLSPPPCGHSFEPPEEGALESVERFGRGLRLMMRFDDGKHAGLFQWDEPPTVAEVEAVLKAHLGESLRRVVGLEV